MTVDEIIDRTQVIRRASHDPELAHGEEDQLWSDVLRAIADGAPEPAALARAALATADIAFDRWYA